MPLLYGVSQREPVLERGRATGTASSATNIVNDLLVGYNDNSFNNTPLDLRGLGHVEQPAGHRRHAADRRSHRSPHGQQRDQHRHDRRRQQHQQRPVPDQRAADLAEGPPHAEVRRRRWNHYVMERYYAGNNGQLGLHPTAVHTGPNASTGGAAFADFLLDQVASKGRGSLSEPWTHLQNRTALYAADDLKVDRQPHPQPRPALGLHVAARREGRPPGQLRPDQRRAAAGRPERQQPGALRAVLQGLGATPRLRVPPERPLGVPRRLRHHAVHGRHRRQPAPAAEPAVLLRVADRLTRRPDRPAPSPPGSKGCRRWTGRPASLRAWDPNLRPQFTQQWNAYAEYLLGSRSSINVGYVGSKSKYLVTPIEGNQPLPGTGPASTWLPLQQRRPLYAFNPLITNISTTASRGRGDYKALQTTFKQRLWKGLDFLANYTLGEANSNNLGYYGSGGVAAEGAYPVNSYDIEANYGPAFFDARHIFSLAGSYELPFGRDRAVRHELEPRPRRSGRRLGCELRRHGAQRLSDHRAGQLEPASLQAHALDGVARPIGDPVPSDQRPDPLAQSRRLPLGRRSARSATPASASSALRILRTSTCRCPSASSRWHAST